MSMMTVTLTGRMGQEPIMMLSKCPSSFIMYIGFDGGRNFTRKQDLKLIFLGMYTRVNCKENVFTRSANNFLGC